MSSSRQTDIPDLPVAFVRRIREQFPDEHPDFTSALNHPPRTSIRLNPHKWGRIHSRPDPPGDPVPWSLHGRFLQERPSFTHDPLFHAGSYYVQEASSMFLERVLAGPQSVFQEGHSDSGPESSSAGMAGMPALSSRKPHAILDACAAPGGKTTLLAALFPESLVVANEVIRSRVPPLLENNIKWGTGNIVVTQNDPSHFNRLPGFFDLILTDAPCSGEGLFRKDPSARREWTPENARHCALRQRSILTGLWPALRPGGLLIYTTCTFNPEENERNVAWLLEQTGGESVRVDAGAVPDHPQLPAIREVPYGPVTGYYFYPHHSQGEGFFLSVIRKPEFMTHYFDKSGDKESITMDSSMYFDATSKPGRITHEAHSSTPASYGKKRSGRTSSGHKRTAAPELTTPDTSILSQTGSWFTGDTFESYQFGDRLFRIRSAHLPLLRQLTSALSVRHAGTEAGRVIRDEVLPAVAAAFDIHLNHAAFPVMDFTHDEALSFLRRENIPVPPDTPVGWNLVVHNGLALGWTKNIGRRMNNYYPAEWRIRK